MPDTRKHGTVVSIDELRFYREKGFLTREQVFSKGECHAINALYESYADENFSPLMNLHWYEEWIMGVVEDPRILSVVDTLSDAPVEVTHTHFNFKKAGTSFQEQPWNPHQDNTYPRARWGQYITVGIALTDQDKENGALYVYPGSHVEPLLEAEPTPTFRERAAVGNKVQIPEHYEETLVCLKRGSIFILHGNTVHGSYPNISDRDRPLMLITYLPPGVDFVEGKNAQRRRIALRRPRVFPLFDDHNEKDRLGKIFRSPGRGR